jgi:hypothetical protein
MPSGLLFEGILYTVIAQVASSAANNIIDDVTGSASPIKEVPCATQQHPTSSSSERTCKRKRSNCLSAKVHYDMQKPHVSVNWSHKYRPLSPSAGSATPSANVYYDMLKYSPLSPSAATPSAKVHLQPLVSVYQMSMVNANETLNICNM